MVHPYRRTQGHVPRRTLLSWVALLSEAVAAGVIALVPIRAVATPAALRWLLLAGAALGVAALLHAVAARRTLYATCSSCGRSSLAAGVPPAATRLRLRRQLRMDGWTITPLPDGELATCIGCPPPAPAPAAP